MDFNGLKKFKKSLRGWHFNSVAHSLAARGIKTKREPSTQTAFERLKRLIPTNVVYKNGVISLRYDNTFISNHVILRKHEPFVGVWHKFRNDVYVDKDLKTKRDMIAVAVHESVEKYVSKKYGFNPDVEAHHIADAVEKTYLERLGAKWDAHQEKVKEVWREEGEQ
jgi:hypothetical protein